MAMDDDDDDDEGRGKGGSPVIGKKLVLIIIGAIVAILGIGLGVAYMLGMFDDILNPKPETVQEAALERGTDLDNVVGYFYPMEEISVAVQSVDSRSRFLKLKLVLELDSNEDVVFIKQVMPRILDNFQVFLRELRISELQGSQGIYRIREELLRRINTALSPLKIRDVLFTDIVIQ